MHDQIVGTRRPVAVENVAVRVLLEPLQIAILVVTEPTDHGFTAGTIGFDPSTVPSLLRERRPWAVGGHFGSAQSRDHLLSTGAVTSIWSTDGEGWRLLPPAGFPDEAALHRLVELTPQLLPLAGSPRLTIVGREVRLGSGSADLIAVEPSGRLVVIEVKLVTNAEARRAVVAQVLAYASHLHGMDREHLEIDVLGRHLSGRGYDGLYGAVADADGQVPIDASRRAFDEGLAESLASGRFRLVIVLDEAPDDLVRLVGYLETVTDRLVIDLVTVAAFEVGGQQVVVPIRVEPERWRADRALRPEVSPDESSEVAGLLPFRDALVQAPAARRAFLEAACQWAVRLEERHLARLVTYAGTYGTILRVYIPGDMSLATLNVSPTSGSMQLFRSVFDRRAPGALVRVEELIGKPVTQGTAVYDPSPAVLDALTVAYEEAFAGKLAT